MPAQVNPRKIFGALQNNVLFVSCSLRVRGGYLLVFCFVLGKPVAV